MLPKGLQVCLMPPHRGFRSVQGVLRVDTGWGEHKTSPGVYWGVPVACDDVPQESGQPSSSSAPSSPHGFPPGPRISCAWWPYASRELHFISQLRKGFQCPRLSVVCDGFH